MLTPVERPSRISTLGFTLLIAWVPPKSERLSSASYVAGCDATSRRAARPTKKSPENSPENPVLPLRVSLRVCCQWGLERTKPTPAGRKTARMVSS